jgi:DNA gyrase subunit A
MATSVPPHNLREIADAIIALLANPDIDLPGLMEFVKGPDFPTGGIICGRSGIVQAYATGRGHLTVRAKAVIEPMGKDREQIVVTELPYQVNPISIFEKCKDLIAEKVIEGISNINDETDREDGLRLVFEIKKGFQADVVLNQLYRHTQLQDTFSINLLALSKGRPASPSISSGFSSRTSTTASRSSAAARAS